MTTVKGGATYSDVYIAPIQHNALDPNIEGVVLLPR
jgi:hypothetical protein